MRGDGVQTPFRTRLKTRESTQHHNPGWQIEMPANSPNQATRKPEARARVSNGSQVLIGTDGRSVWARRLKDLLDAHLSDLGGHEQCSEAERSIIRRASTLEIELERLESRFANSGDAGPDPADLDLYQRTAGNLRRLLESVGLHRRSRDVTPDPLQYARQRAKENTE